MTAKKCTKKRDRTCKIVVLVIKVIGFVTFLLPSTSSYLKVPTDALSSDALQVPA